MASKKLSKEILTQIGGFLLDGMSEREACILCDVDPADLVTLKERSEDVVRFLEKKMVEFKHAHLKELQGKKSDKTSQWLLEKLLPEDFGPKSKNPEGGTVNIIKAIINNISNDPTGIISPIRRGDIAVGNIITDDGEQFPIVDISAVLK